LTSFAHCAIILARHRYGGGRFLLSREVYFFVRFPNREVCNMYVTWELLFLYVTTMAAVVSCVVAFMAFIFDNKKK